MDTTYTEAQFNELSWHDCHILGFDLRVGDPGTGDWTSDLVLDIDFIVEWVCGVAGSAKFRVAPATLAFHGVTDLRVHIDWENSGFRTALHLASIDRIERTLVASQKVFLDRPYYSWLIRLNWPAGGEVAFGAGGFTQTLLAAPVLLVTQHLSREARNRLVKHGQSSSQEESS